MGALERHGCHRCQMFDAIHSRRRLPWYSRMTYFTTSQGGEASGFSIFVLLHAAACLSQASLFVTSSVLFCLMLSSSRQRLQCVKRRLNVAHFTGPSNCHIARLFLIGSLAKPNHQRRVEPQKNLNNVTYQFQWEICDQLPD
jgi:hypothetical protein